MPNRFKFTMKAWPLVAAITIGLCFLTKTVAEWFGVELPDQQNVEIMRQYGLHCFDSLRNFTIFAVLLAQVLVLLPVVEEIIFRWLLFKFPTRFLSRHIDGSAWQVAEMAILAVSSALFSAAHYIAQPFPDSAFIALFFFGLAQCWIYGRTDRIWCSMLNHLLFNLTNLVLLFVVPQ